MDARTVVYADFSCARCYLASQLVSRLRHHDFPIEWRAVEHEVGLPVTGRSRSVGESTEVVRVRAVAGPTAGPHGLALEDPPELIPKSTAAVSAYAEAVVGDVSDEIRDLLFSAYWTHRIDIGNPEKLRTVLAPAFMRSNATSDPIKRFGYAVAMTREPITGAAWRLRRTWRHDWQQLEQDQLPLVVEANDVYAGDEALRRLGELVQLEEREARGAGGQERVDYEQLHWQPQTTVRPPEGWTSAVGDPWRRAALMRLP